MKKKIIVVISGGLGNQLFQYAFARALSIKFGIPILIDLSFFEGENFRKYRLKDLGVIEELAPLYMRSSTICWRLLSKFRLDTFFLRRIYKCDLLKQKPLEFEFIGDKIGVIENSILINGYWQNEDYFKNEISFPFDLSSLKFTYMFNPAFNYVSIHIRRGDYVSNSTFSRVYSIIEIDYYIRAINILLSSSSKKLKLIVFSDGLETEFVVKLKELPVEFEYSKDILDDELFDFWLMSKCDHNIVANSTFSWWAAYLNQTKDKQVICPKNYFVNPDLNSKFNMFPSNWIKI
jgi:hypothetical protein